MTSVSPHEFVPWALRMSVFVSPIDPGLSRDELFEAGARFNLKKGEMSEVLGRGGIRPLYIGGPNRLTPQMTTMDVDFHFRPDPDLRNPQAFDAVLMHFRELAREVTWKRARATRVVLVAAAKRAGATEHDAEVAVTMYEFANVIEKSKDGDYALAQSWQGYARPLEQLADRGEFETHSHVPIRAIHDVVRDVIARRSDGRPAHSEPLDALGAMLPTLGHERFGLWWRQSVDELRRMNDQITPMMTCVLSASLCEASLILVVARAQSAGVRAFERLDRDPKAWRVEDLAKAAATEPDPLIDAKTREQVVALNRLRQRIHVGRLMSELPSGPVPDLRPEEPRLARATLDAVARRIVDWLQARPC